MSVHSLFRFFIKLIYIYIRNNKYCLPLIGFESAGPCTAHRPTAAVRVAPAELTTPSLPQVMSELVIYHHVHH